MAGGKVDMAEINMIAKRDNLSKEEIEQLKKEWLSEIEAEAKQNDKEMEEMKQSYEEKLKAAQAASNAGTLINNPILFSQQPQSSFPLFILHIQPFLYFLQDM